MLLISSTAASAQPAEGGYRTGAGGQIGNPSGIVGKYYERPGLAYTALLAFDLNDDSFYLNAHRVQERPFAEVSPLNFYYGLGGLLGADDNDLLLGASLIGGVNFFTGRYEVFAQALPTLRVVPGTRGTVGFGGGLRYYF